MEYEYAGVYDCGKCKARDVEVIEYYVGGFECFPCAGIGREGESK
jgi:hypothetical protein